MVVICALMVCVRSVGWVSDVESPRACLMRGSWLFVPIAAAVRGLCWVDLGIEEDDGGFEMVGVVEGQPMRRTW